MIVTVMCRTLSALTPISGDKTELSSCIGKALLTWESPLLLSRKKWGISALLAPAVFQVPLALVSMPK